MSLRLRIALTFFLLLFAVLAAVLVAVSAANRANAEREVARQLDAAQFLVTTKGYEQMTVQDVLQHCSIAKGTFYHYFATKQALLEAMLERRLGELDAVVAPILDAPDTQALHTLQRFFAAIARWKQAEQGFFVSLVPVLLSDDNAQVMHRARAVLMARMRPRLVQVLARGRAEGLATDFEPEDAVDLMFALIEAPQRSVIALLQQERDPARIQAGLVRAIAACSRAVERVLGAPPGSLPIAGDMGFGDTAQVIAEQLNGDKP